MTRSLPRQVRRSLTLGILRHRSKTEVISRPQEAHLLHLLSLRLCLFDPTAGLLHRRAHQWADRRMLCLLGQILSLQDLERPNVSLTMVPTVDTRAEHLLATMDDSIARLTHANDPFLVAELPREGLVHWIAVSGVVGETLGSMMSVSCEHRHGTQEDLLFEALLNGSLGTAETPEIIVRGSTTEVIPCHL
jgi:hypothetical protein